MKSFLAALTAAMLSVSAASAATVISTVDNGWVSSIGVHGDTNTNILTGDNGSRVLRNFQVFDITSLSGVQTSATLTYVAGNGSYFGDASETVSIYEVSSDPTVFLSRIIPSSGGVGIYNDLGSGSVFSTATVTRPVGTRSMPAVSFVLNALGLGALNQAISDGDTYFVLGAALTTADGNDSLWSSSGAFPSSTLTVDSAPTTTPTPDPIPLPAAGWMLLAGLGALYGLRRRAS